jgi:hypothetical protein
VIHGTKILARLLVVHGSSYATKFASKTGGFAIMRFRLKRWWDIPTLWPLCFSILFAQDVADIDFERPFELFSLLETFGSCKVVYPSILPVITAMLQHGLKDVLLHQDDPNYPLNERGNGQEPDTNLSVPAASRSRSMSLTQELESRLTFSLLYTLHQIKLLTPRRVASTKKTTGRGASHGSAYSHSLLCRFVWKIIRL